MSESYQAQELLTEQIKQYLIKNPIKRGQPGCYDEVAKKFGVGKDRIRGIYRKLREKGLVEDNFVSDSTSTSPKHSFKENLKTGDAEVNMTTDTRIKTLEDLVKACNIDLKVWNVTSWECTKWEVGRKDKTVEWSAKNGITNGTIKDTGKIFVEPLYRVSAKLSKRTLDKDIILQKEAIIEELRSYSPKSDLLETYNRFKEAAEEFSKEQKDCLFELSIFDHHFGKLAWGEETGENYDLKIAAKRWNDTIDYFISKINIGSIDRILFPIGNDLFQSDNRNNTTTAGTQLDTDARFFKMVKFVRKILIETFDKLLVIAPVDIVVIPGNHDYHSSLWMGEVIDAFYHNNSSLSIDISPKTRKYYKYGKVGLQFTHGNEEPHRELGLLFASEPAGKKIWAETDYHYCQLGHVHKTKKTEYITEDEYPGFQIQVIPSLCGSDAFHFRKGYQSMKGARAFLFHKTKGKVAGFEYTFAQ